MGLRCLIGHVFGEVQTDRDRREGGNEVVVTIREYRECDRCGEVRVVSENKEVRHAAPDEPDSTDGAEDPLAGDRVDALEDVTAEEDDGLILPDEPEEREPGAWPEEDADEEAEESGEPTPWPEVEGDDEGYAAEPNDGRTLEGVQFGSGLTPEAAPPDASASSTSVEGGDVVESPGDEAGGGFSRASPSPPPGDRQRTDAAYTEFFCPECAFTAPTEDSSLRPGDICPNCRLGYLTERER